MPTGIYKHKPHSEETRRKLSIGKIGSKNPNWVGGWTKEKTIAYGKAYRLLHSERQKSYQKAYYKANKEKLSLQYKAYRKAHSDKVKAHDKMRYRLHPEIKKENARKRRAIVLGAAHEDYTSNYVFRRDNWTCGICGRKINKRLKWPMPFSPSIDHIVPLSKGGNDNPANVQAAHLRCNLGKNAINKGQLRLFG